MAAITAAVIGLAATAGAGMAQASSARGAQRTNLANASADRALQYDMFQDSRGAGGFAQMPYFATRDGVSMEPEMFQDALRMYDATSGMASPEAVARMRGEIAPYLAMQNQASGTVADMFSGRRADQMVENQQPVYAARTGLATATKNAKLEALRKTLNDNDARFAKMGFAGSGGGTAGMKVGFEARRDAHASGAIDMGQARLANATDEASLRNQNMDERLRNLHLPNAMAQQQINLSTLPENMAIDMSNRRQNVFAPFRIGTSMFQAPPTPQVQPIASTGQILGQTVAAGAGMGMQYAGNRQNMNDMRNMNFEFGGSAPSNYGSLPSSQQTQYRNQYNWARQQDGMWE